MQGKPFVLKDGRTVYIDASDYLNVKVETSDGREVGQFSFAEKEYSSDKYEIGTYLHLCGMDVDSEFRRQGIGRQCLVMALQQSGASGISAASEQARNLDDGSQLIGDGPGFVSRMAQEGVLSQDGRDAGPEDDE